jgi:hypothetical protein
MSELKQALEAISRVPFTTVTANEAARVGGFLERAAVEITDREERVSQRERDVSQREAAVTLREDQVEAQLKALASVQNVRRQFDAKPVTEVKRVGWFGRRA